jgi:hypothetical protein
MMSYKEQLEKARKNGIDVISLDVANEVECIFDIEMTEREFEMCCSFIEQSYLKSDHISIWAIARALYDMITDEENQLSIEKLIDETGTYDLIDKASWYD